MKRRQGPQQDPRQEAQGQRPKAQVRRVGKGIGDDLSHGPPLVAEGHPQIPAKQVRQILQILLVEGAIETVIAHQILPDLGGQLLAGEGISRKGSDEKKDGGHEDQDRDDRSGEPFEHVSEHSGQPSFDPAVSRILISC